MCFSFVWIAFICIRHEGLKKAWWLILRVVTLVSAIIVITSKLQYTAVNACQNDVRQRDFRHEWWSNLVFFETYYLLCRWMLLKARNFSLILLTLRPWEASNHEWNYWCDVKIAKQLPLNSEFELHFFQLDENPSDKLNLS